jgi:hypothetical protein
MISLNSLAADPVKPDSVKRYLRVDLSYAFGGQIYNNNLIYNPGFSVQTAHGIMLNESVGIGLGAGYMVLQDERFIPVFFETTGCRKNKSNTSFIRMQVGYSFAWYAGPMEAENYQYHGGVYLDAGLGRKIQINSRYSASFSCSYRHQFARLEYEVFGGQTYRDEVNFDMIVITLGFIMH